MSGIRIENLVQTPVEIVAFVLTIIAFMIIIIIEFCRSDEPAQFG